MKVIKPIAKSLIVFALSAVTLNAQEGQVGTQAKIPIRMLTNTVSSDTTVLLGISGVRQLPNGGVVVNDATRRQLIVFDSTLTKYKIIADTSSNSPNTYGLRGSTGGLIPYIGDSSLFVDYDSQAFLVIDPQGEIVRVMAPTRASDLNYIAYGTSVTAGFDPKGRLVYRTARYLPQGIYTPTPPELYGKPVVKYLPDSAPLLRMDFDKRTVDTIGLIKIPVQKLVNVSTRNGSVGYYAVNPLPQSDEWTLLPDGTIAIVRGQDYHIDWLDLDGKLTSSPKMPFDWKRLLIEEKTAIIDSVKNIEADRVAKLPPSAAPTTNMPFEVPKMIFTTVEPKDLPDFYPAVRTGQVRADLEGKVWILPSTSMSAKDGLLYDVVNRQGEIVERVQLPKGRTLVGFGPHGLIYMHNVKGPRSAALERAQVVRPPVP
ncbi:MAG: hypothetical protein ABJC26_12780 [Gemmatimonadaceae bacterium]